MQTILTMLFLGLMSAVSTEPVRLDFKVTDNFGQPVKGAKVHITSKNMPKFIWADPGDKKMVSNTNGKGETSEIFLYWGCDIHGYVQREGYYEEKIPTFALKSHYNANTHITDILEHRRLIPVVMRKKINPIPLYSDYNSHPRFYFGTNETVVAFDLKRNAFLPPQGTGEVADFYIHHQYIATNGVVHRAAEMIFPDGGGAYVVKGDEKLAKPMVYRADPEKEFKDCVYASRTVDGETGQCLFEEGVEGVLGEKDTLVIRSRAEFDETGKIVRANYSKIYGPLKLARFFEYRQIVFNPTVNDTNLELNTSQNLAGRKGGSFNP